MPTTLNEILLRRKRKVLVPESTGKLAVTRNALTQLQLEVAKYGYTLVPEVLDRVSLLTRAGLKAFKEALCLDLATLLGTNVDHRTLFRNFPEEVPPDQLEHFRKRVVSYVVDLFGLTENAQALACGCVIDTTKWDMSKYGACPVCNFAVSDEDIIGSALRPPLEDVVLLKPLALADGSEFVAIAQNLLASKTSLSVSDLEDLDKIVESYRNEVFADLKGIPFKETLASTLGVCVKHQVEIEKVSSLVDTATDVLRVAVKLSNGDVSLAAVTRFRNFRKFERVFLLGLLETKKFILEDMLRHGERWIRLGERLHPGDYKNRFPNTLKAFSALRDGQKVLTANARIEKALSARDLTTAIELLKARPGDFARRLDHLIRLAGTDTYPVTSAFSQVAEGLSTPLLLQLKKYYEVRNDEQPLRYIFPKGALAKLHVLESELAPVDEAVAAQLAKLCRDLLVYRFGQLPGLGQVTLDEQLKGYLVPFSQRSASKMLKTIVRGSRVPLPDTSTVRMFIHWKDSPNDKNDYDGWGNGGTDLDLSATIYGPEWESMGQLSYTNYYEERYKSGHSGDIRSAPDGASEFIDLDIGSMLAYGVRYVVMSLYSYSNQPFVDLPECFAGIMGRENVLTGEVYDPTTVDQKFDVTAATTMAIPLVLDLKKRELIWMDLAQPGNDNYGGRNLHSNASKLVMLSKAMENMASVKPSLYDLFELHKEARETPDTELVTVFSVAEGVKPTDTDVIMGEYLV